MYINVIIWFITCTNLFMYLNGDSLLIHNWQNHGLLVSNWVIKLTQEAWNQLLHSSQWTILYWLLPWPFPQLRQQGLFGLYSSMTIISWSSNNSWSYLIRCIIIILLNKNKGITVYLSINSSFIGIIFFDFHLLLNK